MQPAFVLGFKSQYLPGRLKLSFLKRPKISNNQKQFFCSPSEKGLIKKILNSLNAFQVISMVCHKTYLLHCTGCQQTVANTQVSFFTLFPFHGLYSIQPPSYKLVVLLPVPLSLQLNWHCMVK